MSRRPNPVPSQQLNLALPLDVHSKLSLHLYSELEQRVPHGAYSRFLVERVREFFTYEHLDLAPYIGCEPNVFIVSGSPLAIAALKRRLA